MESVSEMLLDVDFVCDISLTLPARQMPLGVGYL